MEHIIREDYLVEAMEVVELYCDLLLARFGMLEQMRYIALTAYTMYLQLYFTYTYVCLGIVRKAWWSLWPL